MEKEELKPEEITEQPITGTPITEGTPEETPDEVPAKPPVEAEAAEAEVDAKEVSNTGETSVIDEAGTIAKEISPDADISTPEAILTALLPFVKSMKAFHDWVNESIEIEPAAGDMLIDVKNGYTWERAIHRNYDMDELSSPEGSEDAELVAADKAERVKKFQDGKKADEERMALHEGNEKVTSENLIAVVKEEGLDEDTATAIVDLMGTILTDAADRTISKENWKKLINGLRHEEVVKSKEAEVETAFEDGKKAGKNAKIQKKRTSPGDMSDGLARMTGTGNAESGKKPKKMNIPNRKEFRV